MSEDAGIDVLRLWHWQSDALTTLFNFEMWIELRFLRPPRKPVQVEVAMRNK